MNIKNINFFVANKKNKNIHLVGISGAGMSGIALILLQLGYKISGSDLLNNNTTKKLISLGAKIFFTHSQKNIQNIDFIIKSSAISSNNQEIIYAKKNNIPILLRAEMLAILMKFKYGIAIAGTHGKTTTTSMIADIFIRSGLDPTIINGGLIKSIDANAKLGHSRYLIAEADESDASFLYLNPKIGIITNIEADHMNNYDNNFLKLQQAFLTFLNKIPLQGTAIICIDNNVLSDILPNIKCKILTYGFNKNADFHIYSYKQNGFIGYLKIIIKNQITLNVTLNIPGKHNALNATAAIALAINEKIENYNILASLKDFQGTSRRFEFLGKYSIQKNIINSQPIMNQSTILIDDYGHHPTELLENINTIRTGWPKKNLIMIFQPHRYTRTYNLYYHFVKILSKVDALLILNVYSANEDYILGADSISLFNDVKKYKKKYVYFIPDYDLVLNTIISILKGNDIILIQGAGDIDQITRKYLFKSIQKVIT